MTAVIDTPTGTWQPDPWHRHQLRWHDGRRWSELVADDGVQSTDPPTVAAVVPQSRPAAKPALPTLPAAAPAAAHQVRVASVAAAHVVAKPAMQWQPQSAAKLPKRHPIRKLLGGVVLIGIGVGIGMYAPLLEQEPDPSATAAPSAGADSGGPVTTIAPDAYVAFADQLWSSLPSADQKLVCGLWRSNPSVARSTFLGGANGDAEVLPYAEAVLAREC